MNDTFNNNWEITTITYNVNSQQGSNIIEKWLTSEKNLLSSHIVSISLQELSHAEVFSTVSSNNSWTELLTKWFNQNGFILVHRLSLLTNFLLIFSRQNILRLIEKIDSRWIRKTIGGHKGTISCRLIFKNQLSIVFLSSHFIHGEKNIQQRIEQYQQSIYCTFKNDSSHQNSNKLSKNYIFWSGDFNFRIDGLNYTAIDVIEMLKNFDNKKKNEKENFSKTVIDDLLNNFDQLLKYKKKNLIFEDFEEPVITFKPTYKILNGTDNYNLLRMPSWCDRILYYTNKKNNLKVLKYSSSQNIKISDHFPVSATFLINNDLTKLNFTNNFNELYFWNCKFEHIPTWASLIPFICRFYFFNNFWKNFGTYRDWIGIFPIEIKITNKPIYWIYFIRCCVTNTTNNLNSNFQQNNLVQLNTELKNVQTVYNNKIIYEAEFPELEPGHYKVGYFSSRFNCLHGLSENFEVKKIL